MPGLVGGSDTTRKRKKATSNEAATGLRPRKAPKAAPRDAAQAQVLLLEEQILESRDNYNNIVELQKLVGHVEKKPRTATVAAVALCRVFSRLIVGEKLVKLKGASDSDVQIVQWLRERLKDYVSSLLSWIGSPNTTKESTALTLLMRIVKEQASGGSHDAERSWNSENSTFVAVVRKLLFRDDAEGARQEFVDKFVEEHDDVRFYTFLAIKRCVQDNQGSRDVLAGNTIELLARIEGVPESANQLEDWYGDAPVDKKHKLLSLSAHRKVAREAWFAVFRLSLSFNHRKKILSVANTHVLPWFMGHVELLADFLTDSFNQGGSMSLLALSGIFNLMTQKNLDYPDFYTKLYSLLDEDVLHSKHRSRFFRLLETFMNSSHLPSAMVASFIKRLSRLALQSPPGAIVWIVPWTYNILKQHPPCTFMLHRTYHPAHMIYASQPRCEDEGMEDPFDMTQTDPMRTGAIDSSLWELETLRSHYHPNVATLAKIMGEQFTKRDYQLEDFLDHSYASLIDAELHKEMKKAPVVEWEIPKHPLEPVSALLESAIDIL